MAKGTFARALGEENPASVQLLGLCPLLAVSGSVVAGLGLGVVTVLTLLWSGAIVSVFRAWVPHEVRLPVFIVIVALGVSAVDLVLPAFWFELHLRLGLFLPLVITNCVILSRLERVASRRGLAETLLDAAGAGVGFGLILLLLGAVRELIGTGCILAGADLVFPVESNFLRICAAPVGLPVALMPPGAFFLFAGVIALGRVVRAGGAGRSTGVRDVSGKEEVQGRI